MRKPDIFDKIVYFLRESGGESSAVEISPEILQDLYAAVDPAAKAVHKVSENIPLYESYDTASGNNNIKVPGTVVSAGQDVPLSPVENASWQELENLCGSCKKCGLWANRKNVVFGEGNRNADLMFIGEGPGADEDEQGRPFVGRAGQLLTRMIAAMQFDRMNDVYIANIVKCRPPNNRNPEPAEAACCIDYLKRQIELVQPKVIVLLGAVPLFYLMNMKGVTRIRGNWLDYCGIKVMPTLHPAFLLRDASQKIYVWRDLQEVMKVFGKKPVPPSKQS